MATLGGECVVGEHSRPSVGSYWLFWSLSPQHPETKARLDVSLEEHVDVLCVRLCGGENTPGSVTLVQEGDSPRN